METTQSTFIIVGASHAGVQAADHLRKAGFMGRLILIGSEPHLPYQRPPLSKKFLLGELPLERISLRQPLFYTEHQIDVRLNTTVVEINCTGQKIKLNDGSELHYDKLMLCLGGRVRKLTLAGSERKGIHYLRTADDVVGVRSDIAPGKRLVVIGAGFIGLEVAAAARKIGADVTLLEMADRCLNRVTAPVVSAFYAQLHAQAGVRVYLDTQVNSIEGTERITGVRCTDGRHIAADFIVVGVGIIPETELASNAGITCANGIVVDERCRTSDPNIYAAGDCTAHPSVRYGDVIRLESVDNAVEQARVAAMNMCGKETQHGHVPWFWSDQYDVKLQTAGLIQTHDQQVVRGDPAAGKFSVWYLKQNELLAVDAINRPGDFITGKRWIGERKHLDVSKLKDESIDLKTL